ncbi:unnamed protein product [Tenebrio molitor]|nr:unnamed protein product [Tenebrio molitor]
MAETDLALLLKYPLISCQIRNGRTHYTGVLMCGNRDYGVHVVAKNEKFRLKTSLGDEIDRIVANLKATNILEFLNKISDILEQNRSNPKNLVNVYRRVLHEYSEFTAFHLSIKSCEISNDLSQIIATTSDEGRRDHRLHIAVDFDETKDIFRPLELHLPEQFSKDIPPNSSSLTEIYNKFYATIEDLQPFFDVLDELDQNCCVLDPESPTRRDCHRRVWLDHNLSLMVVVDPMNVRARPELKFLGPERLVQEYYQKWSEKLGDWDENVDLLQGLLNFLEIDKFPVKPDNGREVLMDLGECSICFSLRLEDKLPEVVCPNKSCDNCYHVSCLYEWLTSVNSKRIFNQIHGQCPNCEKGISCSLPDASDAL